MRAFVVEHYGKDGLRATDVPEPEIGDGDVLVKVFAAGRSEIAAVVDVYNLPNLGKEVAEYVVSGPMFRTPTARQPPRMALVGVRVTF